MTDINLEAFNNPEVADHYSRIDYITPCEKLVCEKYVAPGGEVLDLGVGGGRTTSFLTSRAGAYVGLDYAPGMLPIFRASRMARSKPSSWHSTGLILSVNDPARAACASVREC
jgi:ubiquinone/menaquinone biosynthesis C-methylase UbiE